MEDLHLCLFSPPPSLCLSACVKQCLLCILASHSRQMERWLLFRSWQGCFSGCHPTVCSFTPFSLCLAWERVVRLCRIRGHHFYDGVSDPLVLDLGPVRPRLPSLDSAFLLRTLPLFCILSPLFPLRVTTGGREAASYPIGIAFGPGALFS